ncbi:MAG: hypothetical protein V5A38_08675 [Halolamina sp.]|uniref:alpha/beta fold hydrolase n=1 Tax=Halolamina sp. TaxID=1940283 RepID=UPI002FC28E7E
MAHGFYDSGRCFPRLAADLSEQYGVITYDARAHGCSAAPGSGYAIEDRIADLVGLLDALAVEEPDQRRAEFDDAGALERGRVVHVPRLVMRIRGSRRGGVHGATDGARGAVAAVASAQNAVIPLPSQSTNTT